MGVRGRVGVRSGERRGPLGSRGKLPKFSNFQPAIPLNSAGKAPLASSPRRKPELRAAPEPERPDAVPPVSKVGGSQAEESAGAGRKGAAVSPGEAGARPGWPAGRRAGERTGSQAAGWRPLHPQQSSFQTENKSPRDPLPARPPPAPHAGSAGESSLSAQPSALPGGPAYLGEAACPGEREARSPISRGRSGGAPSPWHARRHRRRQPVALSATRPRGAWEKPAPPRRRRAALYCTAPGGPGPRPCPPARSFGA